VCRPWQNVARRAPRRPKSPKEGSRPQRSEVTEAVITALHRALRADLAVRVRYQRLHEPGTTVTGILVPTAFDLPARST
jgi:hypothetical protein